MRVGMGAWVLGIAVGLIGGGAGAQQTPRAPLSAPLIAADPARGHVENALQTLSIPERIAWVKKRNAEETREKVALANAPRVTVAVSLSLHKDYLASLAEAAHRMGARLVVQGIEAGPATVRVWAMPAAQKAQHKAAIRGAWARLAQATQPAGVELDPDFFTRYGIQSVPVTVLEWQGHAALVRGAVDLHVALETLAQRLRDTAQSCGNPQKRQTPNPQDLKNGAPQDPKTPRAPGPCSAQSQEWMMRAVAWLQRESSRLTGRTQGGAP